MNEPRYPNHPWTKAADRAAVDRAYAAMDEDHAAHLQGRETDAERILRDAREGLPDLPPVEGLGNPFPALVVEAVEEPDGEPWADPTPDPHFRHGYDPDDLTRWGPDAEGMCRAWGRVVYRQRRGSIDPGGIGKPGEFRSQLDASIDVARHLACVRGEVEDRPPTIDEQIASAVEATEGFIDAEPHLERRYVYRHEFLYDLRPEVEAFLAQLAADWPWGFLPDRYASLTRGEQVRVVERDVATTQERGRRRSA